MLAGLKPARNLLETCSLAGLRHACSCDCVALSKVHHASKSEDLFVFMNPIDLTCISCVRKHGYWTDDMT